MFFSLIGFLLDARENQRANIMQWIPAAYEKKSAGERWRNNYERGSKQAKELYVLLWNKTVHSWKQKTEKQKMHYENVLAILMLWAALHHKTMTLASTWFNLAANRTIIKQI